MLGKGKAKENVGLRFQVPLNYLNYCLKMTYEKGREFGGLPNCQTESNILSLNKTSIKN